MIFRLAAPFGLVLGLARFRRALLLAGLAWACSMPSHAATLATRLQGPGPIICAHRGWLSPAETENDLQTFKHTEAAGRFMLEMDLAVTRDGGIVLMHDPTVDRTTDGHGPVSSLTTARIARLHLRPRSGPAGRDSPPTLDAVLRWAGATPDALLMLDIKKTPPADVMKHVREAGMTSRVLLLTFDRDTAARAFASDPDVLVSVLVTKDADLDSYRGMAGAVRRFAAYIPAGASPALFTRAHRLGAVVITDLLDRADALAPGADPSVLAGRDADIVVSNDPRATLSALR
ncbi:glycerophosphodiester phosphodiesterase family protein [Acetobacteraceae bacterium KSS8]|uniref:Glycerophosphodiester phosphodiesterase family protein n=1 Tax=Endosaccharibacter trunci TaxID=2812733 RepID=A0ABT1WAS5_9PROT|nr:glycerophosphodiester phosphodiesterase family protein [Acetobacteraceae bacterium KSS8]